MRDYNFDVIVLGGGPAGLTAGIYLSRAKVKSVILNEGTVGGQTVLTHEIANYPGIDSVNGFQLARTMKNQAIKFGCEVRGHLKITKVELNGDLKRIEVNNKETYTANAVIIASGGKSRTLNVPGENKFKGMGISYCATCDGDFFTGKDIIVVGGGNSALEEAVALTKYAKSVTIVHQFDNFQAFPHAVKEAQNNDKIKFIMESEITEFIGDEQLEKVKIENQRTKEISEMEIDGVFILIGYVPNTEMFEGIIELNESKEIITDKDLKTNIPGVFAAGDSVQKKYRQITTAVADGTIAALNSIKYINS
ncbi:thioredoxin reductase [bacterium BMS3Abin04]|nr:thioredoxin reductase [bacterium BMS3Abin04]